MNNDLRALFPITARMTYLNHAAVSPPPTPTTQAVESQLRDVAENGTLNYRNWLAVKQETRQLMAAMLGARPEQVAFTRNTSDGLSTVANGLRWLTISLPRRVEIDFALPLISTTLWPTLIG